MSRTSFLKRKDTTVLSAGFRWLFCFVALSAFVGLWGCQDLDVASAGNLEFEFSQDTLTFDTVFTQAGSATRFIIIRNKEDRFIELNSIELLAPNSFFQLNANGVPGQRIENIEIAPEDSIYLFVEVKIDPDDPVSLSPFIIEEAVRVTAGNTQKDIVLTAWGQNANYFPFRENKGIISVLTCGGGEVIFNDPKPYVIRGTLILDSCLLTVNEGTRMHFHGGFLSSSVQDGIIFMTGNSSLQINGTPENPVIIRGDRLEPEFIGRPGQYNGFILGAGSKNNVLSNVRIQESSIGIRVDSAAELNINNAILRRTSAPGIFATHAKVDIENSLIEQNGSAGIFMLYGGEVNMRYCTVSNFGGQTEFAVQVNSASCTNCDASEVRFADTKFSAVNSIFVTDQPNAVTFIDGSEEVQFDYSFQNCLVQVRDEERLLESNPQFFTFLLDSETDFDNESIFVDRGLDYHLDSVSIATQKAIPLQGIDTDIEGNPRDPSSPDIGAYESRFK